MLNPQTILVVLTSTFTGVICVAMMLMVFWQAPQQRTNQVFALMTFLMAVFSLTNLFSRFTDELGTDPKVIFAITSILYGWLVTTLYFFSEEFIHARNRWMEAAGAILAMSFLLGVALNITYEGPFPSAVDEGGYYINYKPFGLLTIGCGFVYLVLTIIRLRNNPDPRPQAIWSAGAIMLFGVIMAILRPLSNHVESPWSYVLTFPYNAFALGIAALIMGRAVLQVQLFNPLRQLNQALQKTNQELEAANHHKDQFLANMSHELRTPLNAIIGYTELINQGIYGPVTEQQQDRLQKVTQNSRRLLHLINDVLDLSKIVSGKMELTPTTIDLQTLIQQVIDSLSSLASEKGLLLQANVPPGITVQADQPRLQQVMVNLVGNAIKFTEQGSVIITLHQEKPYLKMMVQDTGIGIPETAIHDIFKEFQQVDNSSTRQYEGTGLGLAISKHIIELHGGMIEVQSTLGKGSTFTVCLPSETAIIREEA